MVGGKKTIGRHATFTVAANVSVSFLIPPFGCESNPLVLVRN